jgi:hypothetical protein
LSGTFDADQLFPSQLIDRLKNPSKTHYGKIMFWENGMTIKLGLAAAVLAGVGTFAVAEGAGEGGCGDMDCWVGTLLNDSAPVHAGHREFFWATTGGLVHISGLGIDSAGYVVGKSYVSRDPLLVDTTGNCDDGVGSNGDNGCNINN